MSFSDCRGCYPVHDWGMAAMRFSRTPQPRGKYWEPHERPLDNPRKHHYRLEKGANYYNVCLYHTVMARFYEPTDEGTRVCYNYDGRTLSHQFMWRITNHARVMTYDTTDGRKVRVPVGYEDRYDGFGADLWLVNGKLDVSRSKHRPIAKHVVSPELRAWRAGMRALLRPFFDLMAYTCEEAIQEYTPSRLGYSHPGKLSQLQNYSDARVWNIAEKGIDPACYTLEDIKLEFLRDVYISMVEQSLNVRDYRELGLPTVTALAASVEQMIMRRLQRLYDGPTTKAIPIPDFPEQVPGNFWYA